MTTQGFTDVPGRLQSYHCIASLFIVNLLSIDYSSCSTCGLEDFYCEDYLSDVAGFYPVSTLSELECSVLCNLLNLWSDQFSDYYQDYSGQELTERRLRCENYVSSASLARPAQHTGPVLLARAVTRVQLTVPLLSKYYILYIKLSAFLSNKNIGSYDSVSTRS